MTRKVLLAAVLTLGGCIFDPATPNAGDDGTSGTSDGSATGTASISTSPTTTMATSSADSASDDATATATTEDGSDTDADTTSDATGTSGSMSGGSTTGVAHMCIVDGMVGEGEQCDDDNEVAGDGCSDCLFEDGWGCANEPSLCFPECDPLNTMCPQGEGCYPADPVFVCAPDGSGDIGMQGDPCMNLNGCDPGFVCVGNDVLSDCPGPNGCCTRICSLGLQFCPFPLDCVPFYPDGEAPPGNEDVGACSA